MPDLRTIESAVDRIAVYRAKHNIGAAPPVELAGPLAAAVPPMGRMVTCADCPETGTWAPYDREGPAACPACADLRRLAEMRDLPASMIFADAGIGRRYWEFDAEQLKRNEGGWPVDIRSGRKNCPPFAEGASLATWAGEPRFVTIAGTNGNGKTTLAVELARICYQVFGHRYGAKSIFMIRPRALFDEQFDEKPRTTRALRSPITILDEAYSVGEETENRRGVVQDFLSARWERTRCVTIITTNRGISKSADGAPAPIEQIARPVFDRLTDGLLIWLKGPSFRGRR